MLSAARYGTKDLPRAKAFYDQIAALLGAARIMDREDLAAYKSPDGGMFLIGKPYEGDATVGNGAQVGFASPNRAVVDAVHAKAVELGGKCEGPPGVRSVGIPDFYAAYFRDLDGNKLMTIYMGPA